jgi:UDPglucose 6-dehydrogenase
MTAIGWVGLGRLGLPCALALQHHGAHDVLGYDVRREHVEGILSAGGDHGEAGLGDLIDRGPLKLAGSIPEVVAHADVVFVAVQTPHDPRYGGEAPMPDRPVDFEYGYLIQAVRDVAAAADRLGKDVTLVVISTVLPGTTRAHLAPLCGPRVRLVYGPYFIAMSTAVQDFLRPEFVLLGADNPAAIDDVTAIYRTVHDRPVHAVSIESAELLKVAYNCFISMKIVYANMLMEICHKTGADVDQIADGLALATDRIVSPAYMRGGMGDSGGCHPRDNMAMSWLADRLNLSVDLMGFVSEAREAQSEWLADLVQHWARMTGYEVMILGKAYKPNVALTNGSAGLLLAHQLRERDVEPRHLDPFVDGDRWVQEWAVRDAQVFVIATKHSCFTQCVFPAGSVVIDPHGYMPDQPGVTVVRVGRKS